MQLKTEKLLFYTTLFLSFITVVFIYLKADATYDNGDGHTHYLIARYSWKHPHLLLDWWGKPFFTLISSPFAQFGLKGMYIFQALNAAAISWFLFSIANKIKLKFTWTIPAFVFFAPVYFAVMNSGLVEIFFGSMFMLAVWLIFNKHYYVSALVASFIPFVRPEAYVVIPLLLAIYVYRKRFFAIPVLFTATFGYTIIGYAHFKDIFWIITQNYKLVGDNYAGMKGSYFHYFQVYDEIWGTVYTVFLILGIGIILYQVYQLLRRKPEHEYVAEVFVLFLGSTIGCFILHSLLCGMPGILNNLGMIRYLATLIPGSALIALIGLNLITLPIFDKVKINKSYFALIALVFVVNSSFKQWYYPFRPSNEQVVLKQIGVYLQTSLPDYKKIYFLHPLLPVVADADPFDSKKTEMLWSHRSQKINNFPEGTIVLWDSHFMKGEGKTPLNVFSENPNFKMLKHYIYYNEAFPFETSLFIRSFSKSVATNSVPLELVSEKGVVNNNVETDSTEFTFASDSTEFRQWLTLRTSVGGKYAMEFKPEMEFGPVFSKNTSQIDNKRYLKSVTLRFKIFQDDTMKDIINVIEIKEHEKLISWDAHMIKQPIIPQQWNAVELHHSFAEPIQNEDFKVNIYFWNKEKRRFYIDDFKIIFGTVTK